MAAAAVDSGAESGSASEGGGGGFSKAARTPGGGGSRGASPSGGGRSSVGSSADRDAFLARTSSTAMRSSTGFLRLSPAPGRSGGGGADNDIAVSGSSGGEGSSQTATAVPRGLKGMETYSSVPSARIKRSIADFEREESDIVIPSGNIDLSGTGSSINSRFLSDDSPMLASITRSLDDKPTAADERGSQSSQLDDESVSVRQRREALKAFHQPPPLRGSDAKSDFAAAVAAADSKPSFAPTGRDDSKHRYSDDNLGNTIASAITDPFSLDDPSITAGGGDDGSMATFDGTASSTIGTFDLSKTVDTEGDNLLRGRGLRSNNNRGGGDGGGGDNDGEEEDRKSRAAIARAADNYEKSAAAASSQAKQPIARSFSGFSKHESGSVTSQQSPFRGLRDNDSDNDELLDDSYNSFALSDSNNNISKQQSESVTNDNVLDFDSDQS